MTSGEALKLLNLPSNYTEKQLKEHYRKAIRKVHPDLNPNLPKAKEKTQRLNEANELLKEMLNGKSILEKTSYNKSSTQTANIEFKKYKNNVILTIGSIHNHIFVDPYYSSDDDYAFFEKQVKNMRHFYHTAIDILLACNNRNEFDVYLSLFYQKIRDNSLDFVRDMFSFFYNNYKDYIDSEWLKKECNNLISEWIPKNKDNDNYINVAMEYVFSGKKEIVKKILKSEVEVALSKLPNNSKNYLDFSFIKDKLPNMVFDKYDIKTIMMHPELVSDFLKTFNEEEKRKYQIFLKEKNKKISELLKLINKNNFELNNQKIKELQLEMDKTEFNKKYNVFKEEIDELLRHKRSVEKKIEKIKYLYDLLKYHKLDFDKEKLNLNADMNVLESLFERNVW